MAELGRRSSRIRFRGDAAWRVNGLGEAGLSPHGVTQSCTSSRDGIDRTVLAGRGLTCMKRWALGEELSTIRFTMLMRVSLSLICSGGRNGRFTQPWLRLSPHTPLWLSAGNRGGAAALGGLQHPVPGLAICHPVNCFWTSTDVLM